MKMGNIKSVLTLDVTAAPKLLRIEIEGKTNFVIGALLTILLIGMVVGVAVMTIKISRR